MLTSSEIALLLERTSRTFALAIPLLEEPLARKVGVAYLLFRIADTLEDATLWPRDRRLQALASFTDWLETRKSDGGETEAKWQRLVREEAPVTDQGYLDLLARAGDVLAEARTCPPILHHVGRTARGMADFVSHQDERGAMVLADLDDLRRYCYAVAGIVGEMLTELFLDDARRRSSNGAPVADADVIANAARFGEGLQLVNILKDASSDALEGRTYLPRSVPRSEIAALARDDLRAARRYAAFLETSRASNGVLAFCELPIRLAEATLDRLDAGEAKLGREDAIQIYGDVRNRFDR